MINPATVRAQGRTLEAAQAMCRPLSILAQSIVRSVTPPAP